MAFIRANVGYVHAFSHNIGGKFGVPHGLTNAVILPHVMESYISVCERRFADLSDTLNISKKGLSKKEKSKSIL